MKETPWLITRGGYIVKTGSGDILSFSCDQKGFNVQHLSHSSINYEQVVQANNFLDQFQHFYQPNDSQ